MPRPAIPRPRARRPTRPTVLPPRRESRWWTTTSGPRSLTTTGGWRTATHRPSSSGAARRAATRVRCWTAFPVVTRCSGGSRHTPVAARRPCRCIRRAARCSISSSSRGRTRTSSSSATAWTAPRACSSIPIAVQRPDIISQSTTSSPRRTDRASPMESRPEAPRRASSTSSMSPRGASGRRSSIAPTTAVPRGAPTIAPSTTTASPRSALTARTPTST